MKFIWENFKTNFVVLLLATSISIVLFQLAPLFYPNLMPYLCSILIFLIPWTYFLLSTFPRIIKLKYLLVHGICTKATIIDIKEKKNKIIFYCQFMTQQNKHVIVKRSVSYTEYYKEIPAMEKLKKRESEIKRATNLSQDNQDIPIVTPPSPSVEIVSMNEYSHLRLDSIIPILYDPENYKNCVLCPLWEVWIKNHLLDDYPQHLKDHQEIKKQRTISEEDLFGDIIRNYNKVRKIALIILTISIINTGLFIFVFLAECFLFFLFKASVDSSYYKQKHHDFYEYGIATKGIITSATEVVYKNRSDDSDDSTRWIYTYIFTTEDNTPYQGKIDVSPTPNIRPYEKDSFATVLYNPYLISENYLAFFYPYSWIQPEETKDLYLINTIEPEETYNIPKNTNNIQEETDNLQEENNVQEETDNLQEENNVQEETDIQEENDNSF